MRKGGIEEKKEGKNEQGGELGATRLSGHYPHLKTTRRTPKDGVRAKARCMVCAGTTRRRCGQSNPKWANECAWRIRAPATSVERRDDVSPKKGRVGTAASVSEKFKRNARLVANGDQGKDQVQTLKRCRYWWFGSERVGVSSQPCFRPATRGYFPCASLIKG